MTKKNETALKLDYRVTSEYGGVAFVVEVGDLRISASSVAFDQFSTTPCLKIERLEASSGIAETPNARADTTKPETS